MLAAILAAFQGIAALGKAAEQIAKVYEASQQQELGALREKVAVQAVTIAELERQLAIFKADLSKPRDPSGRL